MTHRGLGLFLFAAALATAAAAAEDEPTAETWSSRASAAM